MELLKDNLLTVCDKFSIPQEICIENNIVFKEPYIPYFPNKWNRIIVLSESQNLSKRNKTYVDKLEQLDTKGRFLRLYSQKKIIGVGPWDDGTLKLAIASILSDKRFYNTAVSNAVVWSQIDEKGNNKNPEKYLLEKSTEFYEEIFPIINPEIIVCVGKIAKSVIQRLEYKCKKVFLRSTSKLFLSKISGMFDTIDLLQRYPEVSEVLDKYPDLHIKKHEINKIFYACHALSISKKLI